MSRLSREQMCRIARVHIRNLMQDAEKFTYNDDVTKIYYTGKTLGVIQWIGDTPEIYFTDKNYTYFNTKMTPEWRKRVRDHIEFVRSKTHNIYGQEG